MSIVLVALLRLRQVCDHHSLAPKALMAVKGLVEELEKAKMSEEVAERALQVLKDEGMFHLLF